MSKIRYKNEDLQLCPNCSFINDPKEINCKQCGTNLLTEPADPIQTINSETNFLKNLIKGTYPKNTFALIIAIILGIIFALPGTILCYYIWTSPEFDALVFAYSIVFAIFTLFGYIIIYNSITKLFNKS